MDIQPAFPCSLPSCVKHLWLWGPAYEVPVVQSNFPSLSTVGWSKGSTVWHLLGSQEAQRSVDETQILRIHLILQEAGHISLSIPRIPEVPLVLRALTIQMQAALDNKNLGRWAELMQARNRYLPISTLPVPPCTGNGQETESCTPLVHFPDAPPQCHLPGVQYMASGGVHWPHHRGPG
jgi:hypothetical protein